MLRCFVGFLLMLWDWVRRQQIIHAQVVTRCLIEKRAINMEQNSNSRGEIVSH